MKNFVSTILLLALIISSGQAQKSDKWEAWAENMAEKAEELAEKISRDVERNAEDWAIAAEGLTVQIEEKFENGDFNINIKGWPDNMGFSHDHNTAFLGIHSDHISKKKAEKLGFKNTYGSYITKVVQNSAADKAGLKPFDYIYGVDDQRTSNNQDLSDILEDYEPGDNVELHFVRNGQKKTVNVKLGEYDDFDWGYYSDEQAFLGVKPAASERRDDMDGVTIDVVGNSAAEEMGLEDGDIIKSINNYPILDWDDVSTAIDNMEPEQRISVSVERNGRLVEKSGNVKAKENENYSVFYDGNDGSGWNWNWGDDQDNEEWEGNGAFLGIYLEGISENKARALGFDNPYGSYVSGVIKGTAAEKAGIEPFDYIFGIDEYRVGERQNLGGILRKYEAGDNATVHFYRKGKKMSKEVVFRTRPDNEKKYDKKNKCEDPFLGIIEMEKLRGQEGVRINPVNNSTAEKMKLQRGDVITHINGYQMYDWTDIGIAIDMLEVGESIKVEFIREGNKKSASDKIMSYAKAKNCDDCDCGGKNDFVVISPNIDIRIPGRISNKVFDEEPREDVSDLDVQLEGVTSEETRSLESKGIDMEISNELNVDNLVMAPNPNIGMFDLKFDLESEGETSVRVFNVSGRAIYEYDLGRFSGDFADHINISQNGPGTYFLQITQDGKSFVRKIALTKK